MSYDNTDLNNALESGDVSVKHFVQEESDSGNEDFRPIKYAKLCKELDAESNPAYESLDVDCWGCRHSFGADHADPVTQRIFTIYKENLKCCPIEGSSSDGLYRVIQNAHISLVVNMDQENEKIWSIESIKRHIENHMTNTEHEKHLDISRYKKIEQILTNEIFLENPVTGEKKVDAGKVNLFLKVSKSKHWLLNPKNNPFQ